MNDFQIGQMIGELYGLRDSIGEAEASLSQWRHIALAETKKRVELENKVDQLQRDSDRLKHDADDAYRYRSASFDMEAKIARYEDHIIEIECGVIPKITKKLKELNDDLNREKTLRMFYRACVEAMHHAAYEILSSLEKIDPDHDILKYSDDMPEHINAIAIYIREYMRIASENPVLAGLDPLQEDPL